MAATGQAQPGGMSFGLSGASNTAMVAGNRFVGHLTNALMSVWNFDNLIRGAAMTAMSMFVPKIEAAIVPNEGGLLGSAIRFGVRTVNATLATGLVTSH